jgi:hypothetical protein
MQESNENKTVTNESPELSQEPTQTSNPAFPRLGVRELEATYEMLVHARAAIRANVHWRGEDLEPMAMLQTMLGMQEGQYRSQLEQARQRETVAMKQAKEAIKQAGGKVNGEPSPVPTSA